MTEEENETSLLDLLVLVAENLKLLILGPVVVGLVALGIGYALPQSFTSQAILAPPIEIQVQAAAIMISPLVLDSVIEALKLYPGASTQLARAKLEKQMEAAGAPWTPGRIPEWKDQ